MKLKHYLLLSALLIGYGSAWGQLTGTRSYSSLDSAIKDLNAQGVGAGGVTITITASETAPTGGYLLGSAILNNSLAANHPVTINGNSTVITASAGSNSVSDGILKMLGTDYVTIQGFTFRDTAASQSTIVQMEWGVALLKRNGSGAPDGCQHVRIINNIILLQRSNSLSRGIYMANHLHDNLNPLILGSASDANSHNRFSGNIIRGAYYGVALYGATQPGLAPSLWDTNNLIGGSTAIDGNTIQSFGGSSADAYGLHLLRQTNDTVAYNTINNTAGGGTNALGPITAIRHGDGVVFTALYNTINITQGSTNAASAAHEGISYVNLLGLSGTTFRAVGNTIKFSQPGNAGIATGINISGPLQNLQIDSNNFTGMTITAATNAFMINVLCNPFIAGGSFSVQGNLFSGITKTSSSGGLIIAQMQCNLAGPSTSYVIAGNTVSNISNVATGALSVMGISDLSFAGVNTRKEIFNNTFINLSSASTTATVNAVQLRSFGGTVVQPSLIYNNVFSGLSGGNVIGLNIGNTISSTGDEVVKIYGNIVSALTATGASGIAYGIQTTFTSKTDVHAYRNKVYNIAALGNKGVAVGILAQDAALVTLSDNFISDLRASVSDTLAIAGISMTATGTSYNVYHNTIRLDPVSTGNRFGVSGVQFTPALAGVDLRNNIINVNAAPGPNGTISALRNTSGTAGVPPSNYLLSSNNNIFWAPTGTNRYLYAEGTTSTSIVNAYNSTIDPQFNTTCGLYKKFMSPRDGSSFAENNLIAGSTPGVFAPTGTTFAESGGQLLNGFNSDFNYVTRSSSPDIGALELIGIAPVDVAGPTINYPPLQNTYCASPLIINASISDPSGIASATGSRPRLYFRKKTDLNAYNGNTSSVSGWKWVEATNNSSSFQFTLDYSLLNTSIAAGDTLQYFIVAQDALAIPNASVNGAALPASFCLSGVALPAAAFPVTNTPVLRQFTVMPVPTLALSASATKICSSGATVLSLDGLSVDTASDIVYESSTNAGSSWTVIPAATASVYTTPVLTTANNNIQYRARLLCGTNSIATSNAITLNISTPAITIASSSNRCGYGSVNLSAAAAADSIFWYDDVAAGNFVGLGASITSPAIATSDTFFAAAANRVSASGGKVSLGITTLSTYTNRGLVFNATDPFILDTVTLHSHNTSSQNITIQLIDNNTGAVLQQSATLLIPAASSVNAPVAFKAALGFFIAPGTYRLIIPTAISLAEESYGAYPIAISDVGSIISGWNGTGAVTTRYNFFYDWKITKFCQSARVPVIAIVSPAPAISLAASKDSLCAGTSTKLNISTAASGYTYTINPGGMGAVQTVSPATTTSYIAEATNSSTGCVARDTATVYVFQDIPDLTVTPAFSLLACNSAPVRLTVSGQGKFGSNTIGSGITPSTITTPFKGGAGTKLQLIYTAAELSLAGLTAGSTIDSLGFTITSYTGGPVAYYDFSIKSKWTNTASFGSTTFEIGTNELYYSPAFVLLNNGPQQLMFNAQQPAAWDGVSNLIVEVCYNNVTGNAPTGFIASVATTTVANSVLWNTSPNNPALCALETAVQLTNARPNLRLRFSGLPIKFKPALSLFTNPTATTPYSGSDEDTVWSHTNNSILYVAETRLAGCISSAEAPVYITGSTNRLANATGAIDTAGWQVVLDTMSIQNADCEVMALAVPFFQDHTLAFTHVIIDSGIRSFHGQPYLQRHFDFTGDSIPNTMALVLLASQAEFDSYNTYLTQQGLPYPQMPSAGVDNGNLRVTIFGGTSGSSLPGTYTQQKSTIITPSAHWDSRFQAWEIYVPVSNVNGGYFIHTGAAGPLSALNGVKKNSLSLQAFPNPISTEFLQVNLIGQPGANGHLSMSDAAGRLIWQSSMTSEKMCIDLRNIAGGVYLLSYQDDLHRTATKVVRQ